MANIVNNVDLDKLFSTLNAAKQDKTTLKKPVKLQGTWNFDPAKKYQFKTELSYEQGKQVIEIDSPSFLGGGGNRLGPMAYCIAGITSCFVATFVGIAAQEGIKLTKLDVSTECNINFAKTFDISDEPITEGITINVDTASENADKKKLQELLDMAKERCPAMYSMSHNIKVDSKIV